MRRRGQRGFTLVELMVALVIFSFAVAGALSGAVGLANGYRAQRQSIGAEGAARASMDFIADAFRGGSPGVPSGQIQDVRSCEIGPIAHGDGAGPGGTDTLRMVFAAGAVVSSTIAPFVRGDAVIQLADATGFRAGDALLITNFGVGHIVYVDGVNSATELRVEAAPACAPLISFPSGDTAYARGALAVRVRNAMFSVAPLDGVPTLWMDPDGSGPAIAEPLAEGVEDFQVEVGTDATDDGITELGAGGDDDEWVGNHVADAPLAPTAVLRAVRLGLVARTVTPLLGTPQYAPPTLANHVPTPPPGGFDGYRRRVLTSVIEIRNLGGVR